MFSEWVEKVDTMPSKVLFSVAAGLVFVCQLAALALVANGQVEKAHVRDAYYSSAQTQMADCSKTYSGPARSQCVERINATLNPYSTYTSTFEAKAHSSGIHLADQGINVTPSAMRAGQGFISTAFASR